MSIAQELSLLDKLRTRGYWRVIIRPAKFDRDHVPADTDLFSIVARNAVSLRNVVSSRRWDYPQIRPESVRLAGEDWMGQETDWENILEVWRLYRSGQFIHYLALRDDWKDQSEFCPADERWSPTGDLEYLDTVFQLMALFDFAARLALSSAGAPAMSLEIDLENIQGRRLIRRDWKGNPRTDQAATESHWQYRWNGTHIDLIAQPRKLAAEATRDLLKQFGLELSLEILAHVQDTIGR